MAKVVAFENWQRDATDYSVCIIEDEAFLDKYGGKYLTIVLLGNRGTAYFLNEGYKHYSYIKEKFSNLSLKDAQNVAAKLNQLFGAIKV